MFFGTTVKIIYPAFVSGQRSSLNSYAEDPKAWYKYVGRVQQLINSSPSRFKIVT